MEINLENQTPHVRAPIPPRCFFLSDSPHSRKSYNTRSKFFAFIEQRAGVTRHDPSVSRGCCTIYDNLPWLQRLIIVNLLRLPFQFADMVYLPRFPLAIMGFNHTEANVLERGTILHFWHTKESWFWKEVEQES